jgi:RNA polymerase sigma factor (sigma-70 family)
VIDKKLYDAIAKDIELLKDYPNEYNSNDPDNRDKLIRKNLRIPIDIAVRAALKYNIDGDDLDELIAQGFLGLAVSYDKYDSTRIVHDKPAKFSSVAYMWSQAYILKEVKNIITRRNTVVEIEDSIVDTTSEKNFYDMIYEDVGETDILIFEMRYGLCGEKPVTMKEISKVTGFSIAAIKRALENAREKMKANVEKYNLFNVVDVLCV